MSKKVVSIGKGGPPDVSKPKAPSMSNLVAWIEANNGILRPEPKSKPKPKPPLKLIPGGRG